MVVTDTNQSTSAAPETTTPANHPQESAKQVMGPASVPNTPGMSPYQQSIPQADMNAGGSMNVPFPPVKPPYQSQNANFTPPPQNYGVYNQSNVPTPHGPPSVPQTPGNQEAISGTQLPSQQENSGSTRTEPKEKTEKCGSCHCHKPEKSVDSSEPNKTSQPKKEDSPYPANFSPSPYGPFEGNQVDWKQGVSSAGNLGPAQSYPLNTVQPPNPSIMSSFEIPQPQPAPAPSGVTYALPNNAHTSNTFGQDPSALYYPSNYSEHRIGAPSIFSYDPAHNCNCGDGCQCLGCASHPYNTTTRQHVQEMGYIMTMGADSANHEQSRSRGHTLYNEQLTQGQPQHPSFPNHSVGFAQPPGPEPFHSLPGHAATPGFEHGPATSGSTPYDPGYNQMMMQPSAYYTVEYPVGDLNPCIDMTGTCQCGSDCSCVGCLTHSGHNGLSLNSPPLPNSTNHQVPSGLPVQSEVPYVPQQEHMNPLDYPESQQPVDPNPV